jgi:hypothetical protein
MARKDMTNVTVLDPLANRLVLDGFACAGCGSYNGKLEAIGRSGRFWVVCAECGLNRAQIKGREVFALIRERRAAMPRLRREHGLLPPAA